MFERRLYHHIDWPLLGAVVLLCAVGVVMIYSATSAIPARAGLFKVQIYAFLIGLAAMAICVRIDYRTLADNSHLFYGLIFLLLLFVLLFGRKIGGGRRWIPLHFFRLQPSEFAKLVVALMLAKFYEETRRGNPSANEVLIAGLIAGVPLLLIILEPDFGGSLTLVPIFLGVSYVAGMRMRLIGILLIAAVLVTPIAWRYVLKDYQKSRIETFIDPYRDPQGAGYQQIQARLAVGAGGVWGKGFMRGTQGRLQFLPVAHNDFIFSVLAEEQGLVGVLVTLGLYLFVMVRSLEIARQAKDRLGAFLVIGVLSSFTFQVVYNITMSAGLAPVKGLTLPLMSYGGSSLIATLAGFGLILNVRMRRFTN